MKLKSIKSALLLILSVAIMIFTSCSSTKTSDDQDKPQEPIVFGKYAGVPPQYRAILQEQEEKNAREREGVEDEGEEVEELENEAGMDN